MPKSKSQFDDFDNIQELDSNKDWSIQFAALLSTSTGSSILKNAKSLWIVFPDLKECELARKEWQGNLFRKFTFTTIEAATIATTTSAPAEGSGYDAPWGAAFISGVSKMIGGNKGDAGLLGNQDALDSLVLGENLPPAIALFVQPGNGGPVEDWYVQTFLLKFVIHPFHISLFGFEISLVIFLIQVQLRNYIQCVEYHGEHQR
jgi:hypothetical protein